MPRAFGESIWDGIKPVGRSVQKFVTGSSLRSYLAAVFRGRNHTAEKRMDMKRWITPIIGLSMLTLLNVACGTVTGAAVGAGSGAAIGAGTGYGAGRGALIGTGIGAAAGAIYDFTKR